MALEYPESTIISRQMRQVLPGRTISRIVLRDPNAAVFRWGFVNLDKVDLTGSCISDIRQFGDFILIDLEAYTLVFGEMIGKILYHRPGEPRPVRPTVLFELDDDAAFTYNPTLYGYCKAFTQQELVAFFPSTWLQPLDDAFTPDYLARTFAEPERRVVKQMNILRVQHKVVGVGIGYWQEILFLAGVHPERKTAAVTRTEVETLHMLTRQVMQRAIEARGSAEEKDFFSASGEYGRSMGGRWNGKPCPNCGTTVQGKNIYGAKVYFCPQCQT